MSAPYLSVVDGEVGGGDKGGDKGGDEGGDEGDDDMASVWHGYFS